jgi:hypothetical protein
LEELHQKPLQMERIRWEGQKFSEVVVPEEEEEEEEEGGGHNLMKELDRRTAIRSSHVLRASNNMKQPRAPCKSMASRDTSYT